MRLLALMTLIVLSSSFVFAVEESSPVAERKARAKYFSQEAQRSADSESLSSEDHYLALHLGGFVSGDSYQWGDSAHLDNPGKLSFVVGYKLDPWGSLADWILKIDVNSFELPEGRPVQFVLMPVVAFPEATSKFPLYFGAGVGPGFFFKTVTNESFLAANYTLFAGARLFNIVNMTGFFVEGGLKNHFLLLSDGQFNGYYVTVGTLFVF